MNTKIIMIDSVLLDKNIYENTIINFKNVTKSKINMHSHYLIKAMLYLDSDLSLELLTPLGDNNTCTPHELLMCFDNAIHSNFSDIICMSLFPTASKPTGVHSFLEYISEKAVTNKKMIFISFPNNYKHKEILHFHHLKNVFCTQINRNIYDSIQAKHIFFQDETGKYVMNITNMLIFSETYGYYFWGGNSLANAYFATLYVKEKKKLQRKKEFAAYDNLEYSEGFLEFKKIFSESFSNMMNNERDIDLCLSLNPNYSSNFTLFMKRLKIKYKLETLNEVLFLEDFHNALTLYNKLHSFL